MRAFALWMLASLAVIPACGYALQQDDVEELAQKAAADQTNGEYSAAAADYRLLLRAGQDSPELRSNLGLMLYLSDDYRGAWEQFHTALTRKPGLVTSNLFGGLSLIRMGRPREALPLLEKAGRQQPKNTAPLLGLARAHVALRQPQAALDAYRQATVLDPACAEAWYGRGVTSRELADGILSRHPTNEQTVAARKNLDDAEHSLSRATSLDPDSTQAHMILGEAFRISGQLDRSVHEYQAIIHVKPGFAPAYLGLANTYWKFDRTEDAMASLKKVLALAPSDPDANGIMAYLLVAKREMQEAEPFAERALAGRPDLSFVRIALAKIYLSEGQPAKALPELQRAAPDDTDGSYHYLLSETLRKMGRKQEASAAMEVCRKLRQNQPL